jgi:Zn-dependent protease with chaperone function
MTNTLQAQWYDGRTGAGQAVEVWLQDECLHFGAQQLPLQQVLWPERWRHGQRKILLQGAGVLSFPDASAFDAWADASGRLPGLIERLLLSWRLALMSLALISAAFVATYLWGLPWASDRLAERVPQATEQKLGEDFMAYVDKRWVKPSALPPSEQTGWQQRFDRLLATARTAGRPDLPPLLKLNFRAGGDIGPNAFALPGGQICVTDELLTLVKDEPDAVLTILAHEAGHVRHHHGLRGGLRAMAVTAMAALWLGDYSSLLNGLPILLATRGYSRGFESEADRYARDLARAGGADPARIAVFFKRLREQYGDSSGNKLAISFSTHPADTERIAFFKAEAAPTPKN